MVNIHRKYIDYKIFYQSKILFTKLKIFKECEKLARNKINEIKKS